MIYLELLLILGDDLGADDLNACPPTLPPDLAADASSTDPSASTPAASVTIASFASLFSLFDLPKIQFSKKQSQYRREKHFIKESKKLTQSTLNYLQESLWSSWESLHEMVETANLVLGFRINGVRALVRKLCWNDAKDMLVELRYAASVRGLFAVLAREYSRFFISWGSGSHNSTWVYPLPDWNLATRCNHSGWIEVSRIPNRTGEGERNISVQFGNETKSKTWTKSNGLKF